MGVYISGKYYAESKEKARYKIKQVCNDNRIPFSLTLRMRKYKIILINLCNLFLGRFNRSACAYYQCL